MQMPSTFKHKSRREVAGNRLVNVILSDAKNLGLTSDRPFPTQIHQRCFASLNHDIVIWEGATEGVRRIERGLRRCGIAIILSGAPKKCVLVEPPDRVPRNCGDRAMCRSRR